jgi:hypothetical protein
MRKQIRAFVVATGLCATLATPGLLVPQALADEPRTTEERFRHDSPLLATVVLVPVGIVAFAIDVPIYMLTRKQPLTDGLTEAELIDGYNPMTGDTSGEHEDVHDEADAGAY